MLAYLRRLWKALDVLLNVLRGGELETVSSACGKEIVEGNPCRVCSALCRLLDVFWPDHCINNRMEALL
jgi:hypothetical protein